MAVDGFYEWLLDGETKKRQPYFLCHQPPPAVAARVPVGRPSVHINSPHADNTPGAGELAPDAPLWRGAGAGAGAGTGASAEAAEAAGTPLLLAGLYDVWRPAKGKQRHAMHWQCTGPRHPLACLSRSRRLDPVHCRLPPHAAYSSRRCGARS